jgi:hypothetical protein
MTTAAQEQPVRTRIKGRTLTSFLAAVSVLACAAAAGARFPDSPPPQTGPLQKQTVGDTGLTRAQILRMGQERFLTAYTRTHPGPDRFALRIYEAEKRADNEARARRLPAAMRQRLQDLRKALAAFHSAAVQMCRARAGGGTMYTDIEAGFAASREDAIGGMLDLLASKSGPQPDNEQDLRPRANKRAQVRQAFRKLDQALPRLAKSAAYDRKAHAKAYAEFKAQRTPLLKLLASLPDAAAARAAQFMDEVVAFVVEEHR